MLDKKLVEKIIDTALETGADFAEVFMEDKDVNNLSLHDGKVDNSNYTQIKGIGIRIFYDDFQAYGYTNNFSEDNLIKVTKKITSTLKHKRQLNVKELVEFNAPVINYNKDIDVSMFDKVDFLKKISEKTYKQNKLVDKVDMGLFERNQNVWIANSTGLWVKDERNLTQVSQDVFATSDEKNESLYNKFGAAKKWNTFDSFNEDEFIEESVKNAIGKLSAVNCPCGKMPVIVGNAFGGVIFHEACGHALEAYRVLEKSVYADKIGQQIASHIVSASDDGTINDVWGSLNIDDEGVPTQNNLLIENGVLKSYLVDKFNGRKLGLESTGSGRRESYKYIPSSRMNNTFIHNGNSTVEKIIENTQSGIYAKRMGGGSVNPITGEFNFVVDVGFRIDNGKIKEQVKGARLIGKGQEILHKIDMVGNDLELSTGFCGSISGRVPTTLGQPTIRVSEITVGGQK